MLSVIIPAYNEADSIVGTADELVSVLQREGIEYEVVIVDDGSRDGTIEQITALQQNGSRIKAVRYENNMGKGHALKYGFQFCEGDLVLFLDASDLPPAQIPRFVQYMTEHGADIAIGSKRHPLSEVRYPLTRRLYSRAYSLLIQIMFDLSITDTQVGLKLFKREVLDEVFPKVLVKRYAFDLELLANAKRLGYNTVEVPIVLAYGLSSRMDMKNIGYMFVDTLAIFYRMRILRHYDRK